MSGFNFKFGASTTPQSGGFGGLSGGSGTALQLGSQTNKSTPTLNFGGAGAGATTGTATQFAVKPTAVATATTTQGFTLGTTPQFGVKPTAVATATAATPSLSLKAAATTAVQPTTGFTGFGGATAPAAGGLSLGGVKPTLQLGGTQANKTTSLTLNPTSTASGLGIGGTATTTTAISGGFNFGGGLGATSKPGLTLGTVGSSAATSTGLTLGGFGGGTGSTIGTSTQSIFGTTTATTASKGLGGVDPQTTTATSGIAGSNGKPGDAKAIKETGLPAPLGETVQCFKKYVKEQKSVREDIARMSSTPMYKVQEEVATLKQLLSVVSNGLQRNAIAIHKLKMEAAQELKHAEISQRTKDTPPGLQYENTAPTEYFHRLVDDFEGRMVLYRQQIEELESHLASLHQPTLITPQELWLLLSKLHEGFVVLAAQLQVVHEAVKNQKEHYLNYRKVFHGDTTNIFETRKKTVQKTGGPSSVPTTIGPTPFTGISNAAAVAMATALNRTQQPAAAATGFGSSLLGAAPATTTHSTGFGTSTFGFGSGNTATVQPLGSTLGSSTVGGSLFGSTATSQSTGFGFGNTPVPGTGFGNSGINSTGFGFGATPGMQPVPNKPFQLQKPPAGNKRGKKA